VCEKKEKDRKMESKSKRGLKKESKLKREGEHS
jgi:hypothetical protein